MSDIVNYTSKSITELLNNLLLYKYNPSSIQRVILEYLDEITNGEVDIVDPTNPFVFLLEASAVNTALAINENVINLRKQYPSLAQTEADLYLHMSDKDFVNRFATPASTEFTFVIQLNDLLTKGLYDPTEQAYKLTIPRDSEFKIDGYTFTLQYPINIRRYENGVVQVSYNASLVSPLQTLTNNIIDTVVRKDPDGVNWLFFKIPVSQFEIISTYATIESSSVFSQTVMFTDRYYYCRVYQKNNNTNNKWVELLTTHTDQVYDINTPTAVLTVYSDGVNVHIPYIYLSNNLVSGELRIDVFTTKGNMTINLSNYKLINFQTRLKAIDEERDLNDYTAAMSSISYYSFCDQIVSGGTNGIDFNTLRQRVIYNSVGDRQLPITNIQLESYVNNKGFDLIKNADVVTNRILLATQRLPVPLNSKLLTPANIGISTVVTNIDYLKKLSRVKDNGDRITLLSNNLYLSVNGRVNVLSDSEYSELSTLSKTALVNRVNNQQYLYSPYYYVLDSSENEFEVRVYDLDQPIASNLSFISQNQTLQLPVNTVSYNLTKVNNGYKLTIVTRSGSFYQQLPDNLVNVQISFIPEGEKDYAYINGTLLNRTSDNERVYEFLLETNYDLTTKHLLCITNAKMFNNENIKVYITLDTVINLFYTTSSITTTFVPDASNALIGSFLLPTGSACATHEKLNLQLGLSLKNLWTRSRSLITSSAYKKHTESIPLVYENDVYQIDPVTGSIFTFGPNGELVYSILHRRGDPVLDEQGNPLFKYKAGDIILDTNGNPVSEDISSIDREIDMLMVDGKYYFVTDSVFLDYKKELARIISTWVIKDLLSLQSILLEQTKIFYYPKTTLDNVKVYPSNDTEAFISAEQSFTVDLYVPNSIYNDIDIKQELINGTVSILNDVIDDITINITDIITLLKSYYGNSVYSIDINGLGGSNNYKIINLASEHNRLCLRKKLMVQQDGNIIIKEDIVINFHNAEKVFEG